MYVLLHYWKRSLKIFYPSNIVLFSVLLFKRFFKALYVFLKYFWWFLVIDAAILFLFGNAITQAQENVFVTGQPVNFNAIFIHLFVSVIWFILSVGFLLAIRRPYKNVGWLYFRNGFFVYVKLALVFSLIFLLGVNLLVSFGITMFPSFHWSINLLIRLVEILTIFYWLDSTCFLKDIFLSLELALNFVLYNAPFFLILLGVWFLLKLGIEIMFSSFGINFAQLVLQYNVLKYLVFLGNYFCITLVFSVYNIRRKDKYNRSFFSK
jgi:hypothetical protein